MCYLLRRLSLFGLLSFGLLLLSGGALGRRRCGSSSSSHAGIVDPVDVELVHLELREVLGKEGATRALPAIVNLEHVGGETLGPRRLVLAKSASVRLEVGVEVTL